MLVVCPCKYRQQHINSNNINKDDNNIDINFHIAILLCTTVGWTHATFAFFCHLRGKNLQNFTHLVGQIWKYLCFDANLGSRGNKNYEKIWNTYMVQIHGSLTRGRCRLAAIVGWVFFCEWKKIAITKIKVDGATLKILFFTQSRPMADAREVHFLIGAREFF